MIGSLRGTVVAVDLPEILVETHGIGFEVTVPIGAVHYREGMDIHLLTQLIVREDARLLYGFNTRSQRDLFRLLITVKGIGPRIAIAALSRMDTEELLQALITDQPERLTALPGIGKRTAQRIAMELRDKAQRLLPEAAQAAAADPGSAQSSTHVIGDAEQALQSLGYSVRDARQAVAAVTVTPEMTSKELIRAALSGIGN